MSVSAIPRLLRISVRDRDLGVCRYCGLKQFGQGATFHINHVIPRSKGGATSIENLVLQCPYCSLHKSDKLTAQDPSTGETVKLFTPFTNIGGTILLCFRMAPVNPSPLSDESRSSRYE